VQINPWRISRRTGEFLDKATEAGYFEFEVHGISAHLRLITAAMGLLFLAFAIPDWFAMDGNPAFWFILLMRVGFFAFMVFLGRYLGKVRSAQVFCRWISAAELMCTLFFIVSFVLYRPADFLIQSFGLMLLLASFYLVPNRFKYQVAVSLTVIAVFLNSAWLVLDDIPVMHMAASAVYLLLLVLVSMIAFVRTSYYKRRQYVNNQRLRELSITDPLTRIYNRQKFNEELWREISRFRRTRAPLSLIMVDFDDFKQINDRYGHLQGDRVLVEAASLIREEIRVTDVFARWGGEEFVLLLPSTSLVQAVELAGRLHRRIGGLRIESARILPGDESDPESGPEATGEAPLPERIPISCSCGIAMMCDNDTGETLIRRADKMLYAAKTEGKNRIVAERDAPKDAAVQATPV